MMPAIFITYARWISIFIIAITVTIAQAKESPTVVRPEQFSESNQAILDTFIKTHQGGLAVFDADGTLWDDDIGEAFLRWMIAEKKLKNKNKNIYTEYERLKSINIGTGYTFAVTLMEGLKEKDVQRWAAEFFKEYFVSHIFLPQKKLIAEMKKNGFDVWIVSASNRWIIQAGAPYVGISPSHVLGIDLVVDKEGVLTSQIIHPVTYYMGKVEAIKKHIKRQPDYVAGDSQGDAAMLAYAKTLRMFIQHTETQQAVVLPHVKPENYLIQYFPR